MLIGKGGGESVEQQEIHGRGCKGFLRVWCTRRG